MNIKKLTSLEEETLEEKKKKKKPYDSITYTTGDIQKNIDHFNKMLGGKAENNHTDGYLNGTFKGPEAASPDGASVVSGAGDSAGGEGGGMGESLELNEDAIYLHRLGLYSELPPEIKLINKTSIEQVIDILEPEQEFTVGYVNAIFFYKDLWDKMPIYKCTEFRGYTGVDFYDSEDEVNTDKQDRIYNAKDQIDLAKHSGKTFQVGSDVEYTMQNKLVKRGPAISNGTTEEQNTILFYPTSAPRVCYFVKLPEKTYFIKINAEQLQTYIYDMLDKIKLKVTPEKAKTKIHTSLFGQNDISIDKQTQDGKEINPKFIYKYARDKHSVRALYTNQIYYIEVDGHSIGTKIAGLTSEALTEAKRYVRRYYIKPQNIFCSNKDEVLKALIDHEDEDCIVYTLINLGDIKDVSKLNSNDIIYYYEDGILYDKNHVRIFDYELSIKHEEERPRINPEQVSDAKLAAVYQDRMTGVSDLDEDFEEGFDFTKLDSLIDKEVTHEKFGHGIIKNITNNGFVTILFDNTEEKLLSLAIILAANKLTFLDPEVNAFVEENIKPHIEEVQEANKIAATPAPAQLTPEEREIEKRKYIVQKSLEGERDAEQLFGTADGDRRYVKYKKIDYNDFDWEIAYKQAYVKKYTELKEQRRISRGDDERDTKTTEIAKKYLSNEQLKQWFREHVKKIFFTVPHSVDGVETDILSQKTINRYNHIMDKFLDKFPNAEEGKDYAWREADDVTNPADRPDLWRLNAIVTFDTKIADAPEEVKNMIADAKEASFKNNTGAYLDFNEDSYSISSVYFCYALLKLFDNNLEFYKNQVKPRHELDLDFPNPTNESLHEAVEHKCCICGEEIEGYGNNPEPYHTAENGEKCCDACNLKFVIPARLDQSMNAKEEK